MAAPSAPDMPAPSDPTTTTTSTAPTGSPAATAGVDKLVAGMKELFEAKDTAAQDKVITDLYTPNAQFIDNIVHVHNHKGIQLQFHAVAKFFKTAEYNPGQAEVLEGGRVVSIPNKQKYTMGSKEIPLEAVTTLTLDAAGKIEKHTDVWQGKYSSFGFVKRCFGASTNGLYRIFSL